MFDKILDKLLGVPDQNPPCKNLSWTLPDKIKVGKSQRMKPVCGLGLKTKPTCGGFYKQDPHCESYEAEDPEIILQVKLSIPIRIL